MKSAEEGIAYILSALDDESGHRLYVREDIWATGTLNPTEAAVFNTITDALEFVSKMSVAYELVLVGLQLHRVHANVDVELAE